MPVLAAGFLINNVAKGPVTRALIQQEHMRQGYIAGTKVLIHEERFSGTRRPQQEHVEIVNQAQFHGFLLYVETPGNQPDSVA